MYQLSVSHPTLIIRIVREDKQGYYFDIACLEPEWIQGPREWQNCQIKLEGEVLLRSGETGFVVSDASASLEVRASAIEVRECQQKKYGESA